MDKLSKECYYWLTGTTLTLPRLHRELFGDDPARVIPLWSQLRLFHRFRTYRIFHDAPGLAEVEGADFLRAAQQARVTGGNAASFLTSF